MSDDLQELRAEVERLRREVTHLREHLGVPRNPTEEDPGYYYSGGTLNAQAVYVYEREKGPRLELLAEEEVAGIYLRDKQGRLRGKLEVGPQGAGLTIYGESRKAVAGVNAPKEHGQVYVASPDGVGRAAMRSTTLGGVVSVLQPSGHPAAFLLAQADGGKLEVISRNAKSAVSAFVDETGCGVVRVHESSGETMAFLAASEQCGVLTTFGPLGEEAVMIAATEAGGTILVCDGHGQTRATFPLPEA